MQTGMRHSNVFAETGRTVDLDGPEVMYSKQIGCCSLTITKTHLNGLKQHHTFCLSLSFSLSLKTFNVLSFSAFPYAT